MGDFVTFRNKGRGRVVEDNGAVSITDPRVKFIKGWETGGTDPADGSVECGDGTLYPMEVTVEQLSEIMYRVRDAEWAGGELVQDWVGVGTYSRKKTPDSRPAALVESYGDNTADVSFSYRGYATSRTIPSALSGLTSEDWPMDTFGSEYFDDAYEVGETFTTPPGYTYENGKMAIREASAELGMWAAKTVGRGSDIGKYELSTAISDYIWQSNQIYGAFRTGFSYFGKGWTDSGSVPSGYVPYLALGFGGSPTQFQGASLTLKFSGKVAFIDTAANGDPFDPANSLYLGVDLSTQDEAIAGRVYTNKDSAFYTPVDTESVLKLVLSGTGNEVTAKIYSDNEADPGGGASYLSFISCTDLVFTATKWWPYAKEDGTPMYSETTGLPL